MFQALALAALASTNPANASAIPSPPAGWVVLPVEEYRSLREKGNPPEPAPAAAAVDVTVTSVEYELRAAGTTASGEVRLAIDVFRQGWVRVSVPPGLFVKAARLDGKPTSLVDPEPAKDRAPAPAVLLARAGRSLLALDIDAAIAPGTGSETLSLPATGAGLTRAALTIPRVDVDLTVGGGLLVERGEAAGQSRFVAVARPGSSLSLSWQRRKDEPRAGLPARVRANLTEMLGLGEEGAQASVVVALEVTQGAATAVELAVPEPFVVSQVVGAAVADWEAASGRLTVRFLEPVEHETAFVVVGEARTARDGRITVPLLRLPQAEREEGGVAAEVIGAGEIRARAAQGLVPAEAADLGEIVAARDSPSLAAFRFRPGDGKLERSLALEVVRYTPQAVLMANVEEARYQALATEDGKTLVQALYAVRNNQRSFLKVALPADAVLWSAAVARRPVRPGRMSDGALLLPLEKGRAGEEAPAFLVELVYLQRGAAWTDRGSSVFRPPALDLGISRTALQIYHSPRFRVKPQPGVLRSAEYSPPSSPAFAPPPPPPELLEVTKQADAQALAQQGAMTLSGNMSFGANNAFQLTRLLPGVVGRADQRSAELARRQEEAAQKAAAEAQGLVERFNRLTGHDTRISGALPVRVAIPRLGPSLFFASELTAEGTAPELQLAYERIK